MNRTIPFQKMHGAGNDFIMVAGEHLGGHGLTRQNIAALCDRRTGIGADGLIIVAGPDSPGAAFRMIYFNADGGEAEMCGNGARCTVDFAHRAGLFQEKCRFDTFSGLLEGVITGPGEVEVSLPAWRDLETGLGLEKLPWAVQHACNTGVPHVVIPVEDVDQVDVLRWGSHIRHHGRFAPAGTNVNWVSPGPEPGGYRIRTFERGVEDETLACGTGASASAVVLCSLEEATSPVGLRTRGGDLLTVSVDLDAATLRLRGPAVTSFKGEVIVHG
jgi:diaminopimelate epimerase